MVCWFESISQDKITTLAVDSVLQLPALARVGIIRERLFAHLRSKGFTHLGQVKRVYFEAGGFFTFVRNEPPRPGLKLIPGIQTLSGAGYSSGCGGILAMWMHARWPHLYQLPERTLGESSDR
ncbi:DUF421 domain-containing protein [Dawidia soli]|uniref:YetF C-terminal domain-containing protein n=1 Tax=Dawidia soli TaxID=2782352 RepID=A0AAP2GBD2_9BACT|nr:hypothetical protein [Dawidia soli]MBT1684994.1 hypothetical protein [Dawidia soli]